MNDISIRIKELMEEMSPQFIETFRHLHKNPELSFQEYDTTEYIRAILRELDIKILDIGLETGVVGLLEAKNPAPALHFAQISTVFPSRRSPQAVIPQSAPARCTPAP